MKKYQIIYADPAWSYSDQGCQGTMANHYKGMKIEDICSLPVGGVADENCVGCKYLSPEQEKLIPGSCYMFREKSPDCRINIQDKKKTNHLTRGKR